MKRTILIIAAAALAGCEPMTYEQVKSAERYCTDRGMTPQYGGYSGRQQTLAVTCVACRDAQGHEFRVPKVPQ